jgi:hypothetical protein
MSDTHASASASAATMDDEPKTPMWLPGLGAALFVGVGLWWAVTPGAPPPAPDAAAASASAATPPPAPSPAPAPPPTVRPPPGLTPLPSGMKPTMPGMGGAPNNLPPGLRQQIQNLQNNPHP